ncbi:MULTISPECIES: BREX protein BrxB domain-containing protein [unclassified Oceanispirochaeta]|uniref:BREX protein BrxB domain-containing protein n=1 Tax=unclassified Oceanispirochaeta TaxID=2635722 RepID=UPI000E091266|nr:MULTISPECIES: BREX protein BrxB domain-containing protein [unclassified Oceanispirochaeta]MBF9015170.1 DUF1788 domain-containing protein [Oceanispirochaeta sp. M2]NPD71628.1 DUF1788 domain-containing protein [Oceanispirochaeta sp. M1]RDG33195.1 DUF1788 domain-containing protein [Oceanispirochaeta sp. M1]
MTQDKSKLPMQERLQYLFSVISSERFLKKQGLGNEVPFFICPYDPRDGVALEKIQKQLVNQLEKSGVQVLTINLYDLSIEIVKKREIWDRVLTMETTVSKDKLKELLQGVLDPENHLIPAISEKMDEQVFDVMFISGVGEVFPYIRSHNVLNNLQSAAKEKPTIMFFPGVYVHSLESGASLDLFGKLKDDKYYRAFNIYHYEV